MSIFNLAAGPAGSERAAGIMCSRKACRADASWRVLWNNPKIHTPERRKVWLACDAHREWLEDYLQTRALWKETQALNAGESEALLSSVPGRDH
ncbi:hypothetical protein [Pseudarthrobacter sp. N5]|uniref:hypothetical protein n=1 Tax=Pseudarthrobacter sp. N5 TaxID=3418416 RepID=UPI003CEDB666